MQRQEREVTEVGKFEEILRSCDVCRIGMVDEGRAYVVPMSFGFTHKDGVFECYFHGAAVGRKIDLLKKNSTVCLEFDTNYAIIEGKAACNFTSTFQSIIAYGKPVFLEGQDKIYGLDVLMGQYSSRKDFTYPEKMLNSMAVYKIVIDEITGKEHM